MSPDLQGDGYAEEEECRRVTQYVRGIFRLPRSSLEEKKIDRIGPYQLGVKLGEGGMGTVYQAVHTKLNRVVAIKILALGRP